MSATQTSNTIVPDSTSANVPDIFDSAEAMNRACDDLELLTELAELFAENRDRLLVELTEAVATSNAKEVDEAAHALKGSIGTFSTLRPFQLARELEFCGKEQRLEMTPQLLEALKASLVELEAAVTNFLASNR